MHGEKDVRKKGGIVVSARNLTVNYGKKTVWHDANFDVARGEFVAVIGPNGAGKTTMFKLLLGLQQVAGGEIEIMGSHPKRGNPKIGYVPQKHGIDNETNVECVELVKLAYSGNKLGFSISSRKENDAALHALESVKALDLANKPMSALSGGELQRIFLAEALVSDPEMLLLDEPLSNLDIRRAKELVSLISSVVKDRNVTTFLVAHDINPLIQFLDKVIYIANGKVAIGTPDKVLTSESLSELYGTHVEVLHDSMGHILIHTLYGAQDEVKENDYNASKR